MKRSIRTGIPWEETRKSLLNPTQMAESDFRMQLISEITRSRHSLGFSRKQLAEFCQVKTSTISDLENGTDFPDIPTLFKILVPLGMDLHLIVHN